MAPLRSTFTSPEIVGLLKPSSLESKKSVSLTWLPAMRTAAGERLGRYGMVAPFGGDYGAKIWDVKCLSLVSGRNKLFTPTHTMQH